MASLSQAVSVTAPRPLPAIHQHGAYAVVLDCDGQVLVVRTASGRYYLPGGRIEAGETPAAALRREIGEECGWAAVVAAPICRQVQSILDGEVSLHASYWHARLTEQLPGAPEHDSFWLAPSDAGMFLHRASDRAALAAALA